MPLIIKEIKGNFVLESWNIPYIKIFDENSNYESSHFITIEEVYAELAVAIGNKNIHPKDVVNLGSELNSVCMPRDLAELSNLLTSLTEKGCEMQGFSFKLCEDTECTIRIKHGRVFDKNSGNSSEQIFTLHKGIQVLHDLFVSGYINQVQAAALFQEMIGANIVLNEREKLKTHKALTNAAKNYV